MIGDPEIVTRLVLTAILGGSIGVLRARLLWPAGLRTHRLVGIGVCLIVIASAFGFSDVLGAENVVLDPSRIAAHVVSGIGFLGAGTILLRGEVVRKESQSTCERNRRVRSSWAEAKKVAGGPCSTMTPRSVK